MSEIGSAVDARRPAIERRTRHVTGLILFGFATTHFLNHACGLFRLDAMEAARHALMWPWGTVAGETALYASFATHAALGLVALYRRRHFRMPAGERWQLLLGLSIPPLLSAHAINVRLGSMLFGLPDSYPRVLANLWFLAGDPTARLLQQFILLAIVWVHGCLGIAMWLRTKLWFPRWSPALAAAATLLPVLAAVGILEAGWDAAALSTTEPARFARFFGQYGIAGTPVAGRLAGLRDDALIAYAALLAGVFGLRFLRGVRERGKAAIAIEYPNGGHPGAKSVTVPVGFTILEASRWAGIEHASMCGGRGRCSTCRVLVTAGFDELPAPNAIETATLDRIGWPRHVRLACQVRPNRAVGVIPLLAPRRAMGRRRAGVSSYVAAVQEREIAAIFVDLRNSTRLADGRLPYDALYVVDRYVAAVSQAVEAHGGQISSVAGDGVTAFFGADCNASIACWRALNTIETVWRSLDRLRAELAGEFDYDLNFGVGCHVGLAVIGESAYRHTTQFLGEVGNIAARLEALTKTLECRAVVSRGVLERAGIDATALGVQRVTIRDVSAGVEALPIHAVATMTDLVVESRSKMLNGTGTVRQIVVGSAVLKP